MIFPSGSSTVSSTVGTFTLAVDCPAGTVTVRVSGSVPTEKSPS